MVEKKERNTNWFMEGEKYSGIVTILAIALTIEYTSGYYDWWDLGFSVLIIGIGFIFFLKDANKHKDIIFTLLTIILIAIGMYIMCKSVFDIFKNDYVPTNNKIVHIFNQLTEDEQRMYKSEMENRILKRNLEEK